MSLDTPNENDDVIDGELVDDNQPNGGALVHPDDADLSHRLVGTSEWDGVDKGDLSPEPGSAFPSYVAFNAKYGEGFIDPETGKAVDEFDFVWAAKGRTRAAFLRVDANGEVVEREFDADDKSGPDCRSFDGVKADPGSPMMQNGGDCTTCPWARWHGRTPPVCGDSVTAMAFILQEDGVRLASFRFKGLSASPAKAYWRSFDDKLPVVPPIAFVTNVSLETVDTPNGKFLKAKFMRSEQLTRSEVEPILVERDRRIAEFNDAIANATVSETRAGDETADAAASSDQRHEPFPDDSGAPVDADGVQEAFGASTEEF